MDSAVRKPTFEHSRARYQGWVYVAGVRARIGLGITLLSLLLFGGFGLLSAERARQAAERDVSAGLQQLADRLAQRLDSDMAESQREITRMAALEQVLGVEIEPARWRLSFERLQGAMPHYSWIGLAAADGQVLAATRGLLEGRDVRERPWFRTALRGPMVGDVHEAKLLSKLLPLGPDGEPLRFVDAAAPLVRGERVVGVVGAHLSWGWAEERRRELLSAVAPYDDLEIVLVDRAAQVLLGPDQPAPPKGLDAAALQNSTAVTRTWSDGQRYLTAARASTRQGDYPGMGWTVLVRQSEERAFAAANSLQRDLWLLGAAGALMFGVLGWILADRWSAPLRAVAERARLLAPSALPQVEHDEVAELARALSQLIDDLRVREQALRDANDSLETRVVERTASLARANEDLLSFSRNVSHDLRGPLSSISVLLRQVLDREATRLAPRVGRTLGMVADECDRLRQMTDELLTLSIVEQRELRIVGIDCNDLVKAVVTELQAASTGVRADIHLAVLPPVQGDPVLLRQVWANLLSNALKFTSKVKQPRISIEGSDSPSEVVFEVADNGAGFNPAQANRLFGVFQRLHSAADFPGTGVGLSIVKRAVHRHGGRVWAESAPGEGARFFFAWPKTVAREADSPAGVAAAAQDPTG